MNDDILSRLSDRVADLAARGAASVVRVGGFRRGAASGAVWSRDGVVVASDHLLEHEDEVEIGLPSGEAATAEVIGRDPTTDVALLRGPAAGLAVPDWADDAPRAGQLVVAISRPGKAPRIAIGSVARASGEFRTSGGGRIDRYVETTIGLRPGSCAAPRW